LWRLRHSQFRENTEVISFADACSSAGGAVVADKLVKGTRDSHYEVNASRTGGWEVGLNVHSSTVELFNILSTVTEFAEQWKGKTVHIVNDNVGAVYIAGRGCSKTVCLHALAVAIWVLCWQFDIQLSRQYLSAEGIIASGADGLSRDCDAGDCTL
jgi:hypothetical protein